MVYTAGILPTYCPSREEVKKEMVPYILRVHETKINDTPLFFEPQLPKAREQKRKKIFFFPSNFWRKSQLATRTGTYEEFVFQFRHGGE